MRIHFAITHPQNDQINTDELKKIIADGHLYLVTCRNMDFDFYDAIALDEYDWERDRKNTHYASSAHGITSLSQVEDNLLKDETYAIKGEYDEAYWAVTIVTDENIEEWDTD